MSNKLSKNTNNIVHQEKTIQIHSGPLPSPETLEAFNKVSPGAAEIILKRFENQSDHRIQLEKQYANLEYKRVLRGQWFGFIIVISFISAAVYLATFGNTVVAIFLGGFASLSGIVSLFITGNRSPKNKDTDTKS